MLTILFRGIQTQTPPPPPWDTVSVQPPVVFNQPSGLGILSAETTSFSKTSPDIQKSPAVVHHYRNDVYLRRVLYKSITFPFALNEVREAEMVCPSTLLHTFNINDTIQVASGDCVPEIYRVILVTDNQQEQDGGTTVSLEPTSGALLRCAATSGATLFDDLSVILTFQKIATYITEETGKTIPIVFVNPNNFNFGGRLNANGRNMLEVLRNLCGATGNSFRIRNNALEIGQFGEDSGLIFNGAGNDHNLGAFKWKQIRVERDASEVTSAVYVEGGGYKKEGSTDSFTLLMGDDTTGMAPQFSTVPAGYLLEIVTRNAKRYFRLRKVGAIGCSRAINIGGVSPLGERLLADIYPAQQLLTDIAVKYLEVKSQEALKVDIICPWTLCDVVDGQKAHVTFIRYDGQVIIDADLYIVAHEIRYANDSVETAITLSNLLYDPDSLLESSNQNVDKKGDSAPAIGVGTIKQTVSYNAASTATVCNVTGRQVTIDYSATRYTAVPTITIIPVAGYTVSLISATKSSATLCVIGATYPVTGSVDISGPV